jgi:hypothetical protein
MTTNRIVKMSHGLGCTLHNNCFTCEETDCKCSDSHEKISNRYVDLDKIGDKKIENGRDNARK